MARATIRSIPNKSQLRHLGNCFRRKESDGSWKIAAQYEADGNEINKRFDFGMMPVLALRRKYDKDTAPRFTASGYHQTLTLPPTNTWHRTIVGDFPKFPRKATTPEHQHQACFRFKAGGIDVWLPALELARTLFFSSSYLAHLSLQPEGLNGSFRAEKIADGITEIHMLPGANFPKYYFQREAYRVHLAWLLLNTDIRASFDSIAQNRMANQAIDAKYARWVFNFAPPNLAGAIAHALGQFDRDGKAFLVYEMTGLSEIHHHVDGEVHFSDTGSPISGEGGSKPSFGISKPPTDDLEIEDEDEASIYNHHFIALTPKVGLHFTRWLRTRKTGSTSRTVRGTRHEGGPGTFPIVGSVAEGGVLGSIPQSDFSQLDTAIDLANLEEKFALFQQVIDLLKENDGIEVIASNVRPVPDLPRHRAHLMPDGSRRHYMHVTIKLSDARICHILEVDTSDGRTALATKILAFEDEKRASDKIALFMTHLVRCTLRWPSALISEQCSYEHSVPHPRSHAPGHIEKDELMHWRDRVLYWLKV